VNLFESFRVAVGALMTNKLRSVLTMLGVIIGVAAVISLVSLAQGATARIEAQLTALGSNLIMLNTQGFARLIPQDIPSLMERVGTLTMGSPIVGQPATAKARNSTYDTRFEGVSHQYLEIRNYETLRGRFFDEQDVSSRRKVAVIGYTIFRELFGEQGAIGETINIKGQTFNVIGIAASKGSSMGQDYDDRIFRGGPGLATFRTWCSRPNRPTLPAQRQAISHESSRRSSAARHGSSRGVRDGG